MDLAPLDVMRFTRRRRSLLRSFATPAAGVGLVAACALGATAIGIARRRRLPPTRSVLITGGSRGLGLALAEEYLRRGASVAICARDAAELERARALLDGRGRPVLAVPCDVTDAAQVGEMISMVQQHHGAIDTLVNNAGIIQVGPREHQTSADYDRAFRAHFWGPYLLTDRVLPGMRERGAGRIVNVASLAGLVPVPHMLPYTASKFALVGWSEGLRIELAKDGIRVTTVCPSLLRTGSPRHAEFKGRHREEFAWFSIVDSLPLLSMGAGRAARRIVRASERGAVRVVLPFGARVPVALHALFPRAAHAALAGIDRLLPAPGGIGAETRTGAESTSDWSPSRLTTLTERAARRWNEVPG
jgi:NAD(P)-dependent dehydrogenase (short-subunit alcohol dehydrogenase family)